VSRLVRAAGAVSAATFVSRVLGLLRDSIRSALIGASALSDALSVAFKIPNLLRELFAEGAFSGALVPTLAQERERAGLAAVFGLANRVLSTLLLYVGAVVLLMVLFAEPLVRLIAAPEFLANPDQFEPAVGLVRVLAPFLLFISLAVVAMGTLNVCGRFFLPALSPAAQNLLLVVGGLVLLAVSLTGRAAALPWALLLLGGGALQFLIQIPALLRSGWRPRLRGDPRLRSPGVRAVVGRMAPVALGLAATQISILVNVRLATHEVGGESYLYYGFRLVHLPVGLVGVAVGTAALAEASRRAARGDVAGLRDTLRSSLRLVLAFALPAAAGLAVLARPLAHILFRYGQTSAVEADAIGDGIRVFSLAVVFYCCVKAAVPVFYAAGRLRVPVLASLGAVTANIACAVALHPVWGWRALALAVGVGQAANLAVLLLGAREWGAFWSREGARFFFPVAAATTVCAGAAWGGSLLLPIGDSFPSRLAGALVPVGLGAAAYFLAGRLLRSPEILAVGRLLRPGRFDASEKRP
jgi:putative peptidoglycan lipid II flippase